MYREAPTSEEIYANPDIFMSDKNLIRQFNDSILGLDPAEFSPMKLPELDIRPRKCSPDFGESEKWKIYHIFVRSGLSQGSKI